MNGKCPRCQSQVNKMNSNIKGEFPPYLAYTCMKCGVELAREELIMELEWVWD